MSRRLVVLTELIAPYRIPVFNALAATREIDLHVIFLSRTDTSMRQWSIYENEIQFSYQVLPSWRRRIARYNLLLNANLGETLRQAAPETLICGGYNYFAAWQAMNWAKRNGAQFLLWCESTALDRRNEFFAVEWLKREFARNCTGFIVPGKSARNYVEQFASPQHAIFMAPNAVDIRLFASKRDDVLRRADRIRGELGLPPRFYFFAGRLVRSKGVIDLISAYAALPPEVRSEVSLVFAGDGPMRAELEPLARDIYPGAVYFAGFVQRDDLAAYYSLAECLVLPTHSDPWGLVVNEAMACALPVICTNVAGCAADLVRDNGIVIDPGNVPQLTRAMLMMARDFGLRSSMSRESLKLISYYSPQACADGIARAARSSKVEAYA